MVSWVLGLLGFLGLIFWFGFCGVDLRRAGCVLVAVYVMVIASLVVLPV